MHDVLVIQAARLGDLIQTRRLVLSLGQSHRVHLAIDRNLCELAKLVYPDAVIHPMNLHGVQEPDFLETNARAFAELQAQKFERVYNCNFSGLTAAICRLFEEERLTGYRPWHCSQGGEARSPWARVGFRASSMRPLSPLNLVDYWGWFCEAPIRGELVNPPAIPKGGGLGVAVAGREERRSIPVAALASMIQILAKTMDCREIRLFGTKSNVQHAKKLQKLLKPDVARLVRDLCGKTSLPQLAAEVAGLDLLLTPDTGIMHMAAWQGVPVLAVFLSSAWCHETGPYGLGHWILQSVRNCSPCLETAVCPHETACARPFQSREFSRLLTMLFSGKPLDAPADIQVWRPGFDRFGLGLKLAAGVDAQAELRGYCREIIANWLGVDQDQSDTREYMELLRKFDPDEAWMLPPWRYC